MKRFQRDLVEMEAEHLLLDRTQLVDIDRLRNGNREALTVLRRKARTTRSSVLSPIESLMKDIGGSRSRPLVQEVCATCGEHDPRRKYLDDVLGPFHAANTVLEEDQSQLEFEAKRLQSYVKEKSFAIWEKGALADKISPGLLRPRKTIPSKQLLYMLR